MDGRALALARLREDRGLAATCAVLLVLVAVGVAGLLALDAGMRDAAVRARVGQLAPDRASLTIGTSSDGPVPAQGPASGAQDRAVREDVGRAMGELPATVRAAARSDQLPVLDPQADGAAAVVLLVAEDLPGLADLVDGTWAAAADEVALQADAAASLGVGVGDRLEVAAPDAAEGAASRSFVVSGTWRVPRASQAAVGGDPLLLTGRQSTTAVGPAVPADPAVLGEATRTWWVAPDVDRLDLASARRLPGAAQAVVDAVRSDPRLPAARATTGLAEDLPPVLRAAGAAGATGRVVLLVVSAVALTAVLAVAALLVQRRAGHTALLRARGASWPQVVGSTLAEAGVLVLPALVLAGVLAVAVPDLRPAAPAVAACALVAAAVLALPAVLAARRWEAVRDGASGRRTAAVRVGGEVVVVGGAALALWQLRRPGGSTAVQDDGGLLERVDLVVVAAPVLGLLAGALVAARLVQPVSAVVARSLARRPGLPAIAAAWQTSRAPAPYAVTVLLVVVLVGTGVLLTGTAATRSAEHARVAARQVGADVRVSTEGAGGAGPAASARSAALAAALAGVEGVAGVTGVLVEPARTAAGPVSVVARTGDPGAIQDAAGPTLATGGAVQVGWTASVRAGSGATPAPGGQDVVPAPSTVVVSAAAWWLARSGYPVRTDLGSIPVTTVLDEVASGQRSVAVDLPAPPGGGDDAWRLVAVDVVVAGLGAADHEVSVGLVGLSTAAGALDGSDGSWSAQGTAGPVRTVPGEQPGVRLEVPLLSAPTTTARVLATDLVGAQRDPVPATVSRDVLAASGVAVGDPLLVRRVQGLDTEVVGAVPQVAGVEGPAVVVDQRTLARADLAAGRDPSAPGEWEVALADPSGSADRAAALAGIRDAADVPVQVVDRDGLEADLAADPLSSGALRTGVLGAGVVALLALVGLVANGAVSARRRLRDDTVLAVLGADAGQQRRADLVRTALLGALAVVAGVLTGGVVLALAGPALVGDPTALGRPAGVGAAVPVAAVAAVAAAGALLSAVPGLVRDPAARAGVAARMRLEEPS